MTADVVSRKVLLTASAGLTLTGSGRAPAVDRGASSRAGTRTLVSYFSRSGNTRVIAGTLQRLLGADLFEIRFAITYPDDYEATVEQAGHERDRGFEPPLADRGPSIDRYAVIYLGLPIWGETAPPPVKSFLRTHDLHGKTLRPFITHGGYGLGDSMTVIRKHAPGAAIESPFALECDQERRTINLVKNWLEGLQAAWAATG